MKKRGEFSPGKRFLSGKGFYLALAICLVGAGAAVFSAMRQALRVPDAIPPEPLAHHSMTEEGPLWQPEADLTAQEEPKVPILSESSMEDASSCEASSPSCLSDGPVSGTGGQAPQKEVPSLLYVLPVDGEIFGRFSDGELVKNETLNEWRTHDGIDIKADVGVEVMACADGVVEKVWADPLWGSCVSIRHGEDIVSCYAGLAESPSVQEGDAVSGADIIGTVGETNLAEVKSGPHLHFSMKEKDRYVDPLVLMDKVRK